jgi:hypothetical protein
MLPHQAGDTLLRASPASAFELLPDTHGSVALMLLGVDLSDRCNELLIVDGSSALVSTPSSFL